MCWRELGARVWRVAAGLVDLGVEPQGRVAIASSTRIEWILGDFAVMVAGGATTTIYPTTIPRDVAFILSDSGARVVVAEDVDQVTKLREIRAEIPEVRTVVVIDETGVDLDEWVTTLAAVEAVGAERLAAEPGLVDARIDACTPDDLATIIYTSGTTGRPKGVRLTHEAWTYQGAAIKSLDILHEDDVQYMWLPLAHVFGKQITLLTLATGMSVAVDGRLEKIAANLVVVRPTFMCAAPRIFEKVYSKISLTADEGGAKAKLFAWASGVARRWSVEEQAGRTPSAGLKLQHALADKLVFSKIRERFGGRIRFFISGSAALNADVAAWFNGAGVTILEGYGMTETSACATVNRPYANRLGSVGWPAPRTEIRIAEDGEILMRGPGVMQGYHNNPEATAEALTEDGWLHSGDIGEIDERGFVRVTDRKKDLFKTSNGKYVAPSQVESTFKGLCPYVGQILVHGADRNFVTALITLDPEAIQPWAEANGLGDRDYTEIVSSAQARDMVQSYVDELNEGLNRWERIGRFRILDHDLTVEGGELTPSLKLRRKVVAERYQDVLEDMHLDQQEARA
ncbi:AMP-dependent synthetase/ligase [Janibacter endophyticus]|uniref:AMP-dependent synthetase/ligase n=1 Tax=Janibacter endophyticus TaxID=2806261 RepID=UPI0027DAEC83|nr:long-chain fatty acid--CoA ligase [Janibacter endophyticus]